MKEKDTTLTTKFYFNVRTISSLLLQDELKIDFKDNLKS